MLKKPNTDPMPQCVQTDVSGSYYSCIDCDWGGEISECEFDTEYDEFKGNYKKYPICPKCGGGLDC